MTPSEMIAPLLAPLRRYARALAGSQAEGDAFVAATLAALINGNAALDASLSPRVALYRVFQTIWSDGAAKSGAAGDARPAIDIQKRLQSLPPLARQALLLTAVEGFTEQETGQIIAIDHGRVVALIEEARAGIERQSRARVLIIEDEAVIAMDLADIVTAMGHTIVATADTASRAVAAAQEHKPDLVLADIQLADGSSGIDAVQEILSQASAPVIFITAFPERLLTGQRPEPTYLISKPYMEDTVRALVSHVLYFKPAS